MNYFGRIRLCLCTYKKEFTILISNFVMVNLLQVIVCYHLMSAIPPDVNWITCNITMITQLDCVERLILVDAMEIVIVSRVNKFVFITVVKVIIISRAVNQKTNVYYNMIILRIKVVPIILLFVYKKRYILTMY